MELGLYGATLTVSYDESAARVYVLTEMWSRAVKQVGAWGTFGGMSAGPNRK